MLFDCVLCIVLVLLLVVASRLLLWFGWGVLFAVLVAILVLWLIAFAGYTGLGFVP